MSEDALAKDRFAILASCSQMATPRVAEQKCEAYNREEFFEFWAGGHLGGFEMKSTLFQMTKEQFDTPAKLVKFERFGARKAIANEMKSLVATSFASDDFSGKVDFQPPNQLPLCSAFSFACGPIFGGQLPTHNSVGLDADDVSDALVIKPSKPFAASEFAVHGEHVDVLGLHQTENALENSDAVVGVGVAAFRSLRKNLPSDGNGHLPNYHSYRKNVDVALTVFPVSAIHGENPPLLGAWDSAQDQAANKFEIEGTLQEESLKAAVATFIGRTRVVCGGENGEVDGAVAKQTGKQKRETLEASEVEFERCEF